DNPQTAALLQGLEAQAKNTLPFIKFQEALTGSVIIPESHVRERWDLEKQRRTIKWGLVSVTRFSDAINDVPHQDIQAYFNEHKDKYKREEQRTLDFVFFPLQATAQDSAEVLERAQMLAQRAKNGEDFADLANGYSMDPGNDDGMGNRRGGDLGYFGKGTMVKVFEDVAFSMKPGEISDPFLSPFGYHIVKIDSLKYKEDDKKRATKEVDQVKARHILLTLDPSSTTRDEHENRVTAFQEKVSKGGDFAQSAREEGLEVGRTAKFNKESTFIGSIGQNPEILINRSFNSNLGDVLPPYWTDPGAFVLRVAEIYEAGIPPLEEIQNQVKEDVRKEKGRAKAQELANNIDRLMKSGKTFEEAAAADSTNPIAVQTETVTRVQRVRILGAKSPLIAAAFQLKEPGDSTGPVDMEQGVGIAVLESIEPLDTELYEKEREQTYEQLVREKQNLIISRTMEDLRKNAKIVDHRYMYYNL
ncbi:MAG: peptidylprolyl isomerase, partial [Candidatus Latescibacteria bacterium]|nr:peptidylprolyl isomerase [Candidatus Latescibacterota bacterium]